MAQLGRMLSRNTWIIPLILLALALAINRSLQENLFELRVLNGNLRVFLPAILLAVGQTIAILSGGIDLSVGSIVSMVNAILVTTMTADSTPDQVILSILVGCGAGLLAGAVNGLSVAYLRLPAFVTTFATSYLFGGLALLILPRPGGSIPSDLPRLYRSTPGDIPFVLYMIVLVVLIWLLLRSTRFGQNLYATGGKADAAYRTGIPVRRVRFTAYLLSGLFAALSALALTLSTSTGNPRSGELMMLNSIVAVVIGGTSLSGGQGGVLGTIFGVILLGTIRNIISFANVDTWSQTLVDALITLAALALPGLIYLVRRVRPQIAARRRSSEYASLST
jgi:ribose transport system permease protein